MFTIGLLEQTWLEGCDPSTDLCSHGRLRIVIGDEIIADGSEDFGISETALGLLRTLVDDRRSQDEPERLVLHGCGLILMMGCSIGIDWNVEHRSDFVRLSEIVRHDSTNEAEGRRFDVVVDVPRNVYREEVLALADAVKTFFAASQAKDIADPFDQAQYRDFWQEFDSRLTGAP